LLNSGYRAEVAESIANARRIGLDGITLAILAPDVLGAEQTASVEELRASVGRVLVVGSGNGPHGGSRVINISDEARLLARVAEALAPRQEPEAAEEVLEFAGYRLDLGGHSLSDPAGKEIALRPAEFNLLRALAQRSGRVLSRDQLLQLTSGRDAEPYDRSVDMQIMRLRRKIEPEPERPSLIVTVPGCGYKFAAAVRKANLRAETAPEAPSAVSHPLRVAGFAEESPASPALPDKPSIAVLPFQEYERRSRTGLFRGRDGRRHRHRPFAYQVAVRDRAQLQRRLQGPDCRAARSTNASPGRRR
jgi:DNA-binding winged helix-turn-helix (wHTH) protein